jgi:hypothetical protein
MYKAGCTYGRNEEYAQNFRGSVKKLLRPRWRRGVSSNLDPYVIYIYIILQSNTTLISTKQATGAEYREHDNGPSVFKQRDSLSLFNWLFSSVYYIIIVQSFNRDIYNFLLQRPTSTYTL